MTFGPERPKSWDKWLRKPSGGLPFENLETSSSKMMLVADRTLAIRGVFEGGGCGANFYGRTTRQRLVARVTYPPRFSENEREGHPLSAGRHQEYLSP